jgi:hypothetical protein
MAPELDEKGVIKFFESRIKKCENIPSRELLLEDLKELFEILEPGLSPGTKNYLDKIIKESLKREKTDLS